MIRIATFGLALALVGSSLPAVAQPAPSNVVSMEPDSLFDDKLLEGITFLQAGKPNEANQIFSQIIASFESSHDPATPYRCANPQSSKDTISYTLKSLKGKKFILGSEAWCTALWGKGFALIDLGKPEEAGPYLARAVEMDPLNAHFINEYAEWYKPRREWQTSYDLFLRAWRTVDHDKRGENRRIAARSLRGMAFNQIELGDLKEAGRLYRQSLEYEPEAAAKVQNELDYIADALAKRKVG